MLDVAIETEATVNEFLQILVKRTQIKEKDEL
jgi:hypothetical protein